MRSEKSSRKILIGEIGSGAKEKTTRRRGLQNSTSKSKGGKGTFSKFYNAMELSVQGGEKLLVNEIINGFGMSTKTDGTKGWVPMKNMELKTRREDRRSRNAKHDPV